MQGIREWFLEIGLSVKWNEGSPGVATRRRGVTGEGLEGEEEEEEVEEEVEDEVEEEMEEKME